MNMHRLLKIFAIITSIGAYIMIVLGVLVTATGSGQGCGNSWPFCHGQIIPGVITVSGMYEYGHRIGASTDGFLVLILAVWSWLMYRKDFRVKLFAFMSLLFILLQGALGALTVVYEGKWELSWLLSVHFGLSLIALASVVLLTIRIFQLGQKPQSTPDQTSSALTNLRLPIWGLAIYTYIVVYSGALVEHTGAVSGCGYQVVGCGTTFLPNLSSLAGIQVLHRYFAGLLWLLVLGLLVVVMRRYRNHRDIVQGTWWAFILISLQAISGALNVLTTGQLLASILHATLISIFFSIICFLCAQVGWPAKRNARHSVGAGEADEAGLGSLRSPVSGIPS